MSDTWSHYLAGASMGKILENSQILWRILSEAPVIYADIK